ncbi:MAG: type II toxin-antitoxin system VapC family toxin [Proteobacteria bacterium]|nr:type II toxin-antitoxin system VapC family toxin [Pseudomonadota bacterium]MYJ97325.1 type II toxin-antitoxin system VapC family toxin [Pseudomonadota bacterium]
MAFVLDCSVTMAWVFPDEATEATNALLESLAEGNALVPSLWPVEVGNVLLMGIRRGRVAMEERSRIREILEALPIRIDQVSLPRVLGASLSLAHRHELSLYDAMYLELAIRMRMPLATLDRALGAAGRAAGIEVLGYT